MNEVAGTGFWLWLWLWSSVVPFQLVFPRELMPILAGEKQEHTSTEPIVGIQYKCMLLNMSLSTPRARGRHRHHMLHVLELLAMAPKSSSVKLRLIESPWTNCFSRSLAHSPSRFLFSFCSS